MTDTRLHQWLQHQLTAGLPALAGARVTASLPLQVPLVNELIAEALADARSSGPPAPAGAPGRDLAPWLRHVKAVTVGAAADVITLNVELAIDE